MTLPFWVSTFGDLFWCGKHLTESFCESLHVPTGLSAGTSTACLWEAVFALEGEPEPRQHEQRGFLGDTGGAGKFVAADGVLAGCG